ncbi:hypothetical protein [Dyella psychrodurans]|uniref:hypothetical protein n=1 Tax=Dyella psychrodurans TaxID=1927960 RepID=UPI00131443FB|nr:hypothetical protein [Dyella psychrodurans]
MLLIMLIAGCSTNSILKDTAMLPPGTGIMVAHVSIFSETSSFKYDALSIKVDKLDGSSIPTTLYPRKRSNLIVIALPAGEYNWATIDLGLYAGSATSYRMPFTIEAGKINYVGDLLLTFTRVNRPDGLPTYKLRIEDQSKVWLPTVASDYPQLSRVYPSVIHLTEDQQPTNQAY